MLYITVLAISNILSIFPASDPVAVEAVSGGGGFDLFGTFTGDSPITNIIFTKQYSINAINTNIVQTDIKASTAFKYETGGNAA